MKKIDWTPITAANGLVFEEKTFEHINDGHKDSYIAFVKANIPSAWHTGKLVILYGCVDSGTPPARNLSAGAVYYNGEIYQVDSASFTTTGSQIGIWTITDVDSGTDESTIKTASSSFTDHVLVNSKFVFAAGLSNSGTFDEGSSNIVRFDSISTNIITDVTQDTFSTSSYVDMTGITFTTPNDGVTRRWLITFSSDAFSEVAATETTRMDCKLYNSTDDISYATTWHFLNSGSIGDVVDYGSTLTLVTVQTIEPNKVIKVAGKRTTASSYNPSVRNKILNVVEI